MIASRSDLERFAAASGYGVEALEKVLHLLALLASIRQHPFLGKRVALKGGTALNLFALDVPRLSVDIDLNYVGAADRATMLEERPRVERAIQDVCARAHLAVHRIPDDFAGGKWRLSYEASGGGRGSLELDMNFVLRTPLWPASAIASRTFPGTHSVDFPVLDVHELAAGKLAALLARGASRDIFDARELLRPGTLDRTRLRIGFIVYGGANPVDWRTVTASAVRLTTKDVEERLLPLLREDLVPDRRNIPAWTDALVRDCQGLLGIVLPLTENERAFLDGINDRGEIVPALLTDDERLRAVIAAHPALAWKALNVRKHHGLAG
jgi:predicted nucleotidyltransferase component of viral defense system